MRTSLKYLLVALLCLPVFFINVKSSHDWGDDFAQYLHQAKNIVEGIPQTETGYIFNPEYFIGPPAYPVGFPLLLAPIYAACGLDIYYYDLYISFFLFLLGMLMFHYFRKYFSDLIAVLLVLVFVFNPSVLSFKSEIMSDIPFTFFQLFLIILYLSLRPLNLAKTLLLAGLTALLISIRNIGAVFVFAVILDSFLQLYKHRKEIRFKTYNYTNEIYSGFMALIGFGIYLILNKIVFKIGGEGLFAYDILSDFSQIKHIITTNLNYNLNQLRNFFDQYNGDLSFLSLLCGTFFFSFSLIGILKRIFEKIGFFELYIGIYFITVLVFPYSSYGFRFVLPLIPFLLYYFIEGLKCINITSKIKGNLVTVTLFVMVLFSYQIGLTNLIITQSLILNGTQDNESVEAFEYINHNTPKGARFNFIKPRALSLYVNRSVVGNPPMTSQFELLENMKENKVDYFLIHKDISYDSTKAFVGNSQFGLKCVWNNSKYTLYKR